MHTQTSQAGVSTFTRISTARHPRAPSHAIHLPTRRARATVSARACARGHAVVTLSRAPRAVVTAAAQAALAPFARRASEECTRFAARPCTPPGQHPCCRKAQPQPPKGRAWHSPGVPGIPAATIRALPARPTSRPGRAQGDAPRPHPGPCIRAGGARICICTVTRRERRRLRCRTGGDGGDASVDSAIADGSARRMEPQDQPHAAASASSRAAGRIAAPEAGHANVAERRGAGAAGARSRDRRHRSSCLHASLRRRA